MANTIKIKRGLSSDISQLTLQPGEMAIVLDTRDLKVGNSKGIVEGINAATANKLTTPVDINGIVFDGSQDVEIPALVEQGVHISIVDGVISVTDMGDLTTLNTTNKDTIVGAINELTEVDNDLSGSINAVQLNLNTNTANLQSQIDNLRESGDVQASELHNTLMDLDASGAVIGSNNTTIKLSTNGESFQITSGGQNILKAGLDNTTNSVFTEANQMKISDHFTAGYHRQQKFSRDGELRTGWFWVGGDE